ncbi:MAG: trypsin-like serine protease [Myxococcales bacterium]|nr:trypsin-like serine protease [Myxococcales bacterium]
MRKTLLSILGLGAALGLAACAPDDVLVHFGSESSAITDGTPHSGHPSVGQHTAGGGLCTATLIGPRTVLTAAHCGAGSGNYFEVGGQRIAASQRIVHPQYSAYGNANDISILILSQAVTSVQPTPINIATPTVGQPITLVGYGVTSENGSDSGTKRIAKNSIATVRATTISFLGSGNGTGNTCYGDSGGPAFVTVNGVEVVAGVTSYGTPPCGVDGVDTRVDAYKDWIAQVSNNDALMGEPPKPADSTAPTVRIVSPTPGGKVATSLTLSVDARDDTGVARVEVAYGGAIAAVRDTAPYDFQLQLQPGQHRIDVRALDGAGNQGTASVTVTVDAGATPTPTPSPGTYGASCSVGDNCQSKMCAEDPDYLGQKYCTQACTVQTGCPNGGQCYRTADPSLHVCGKPPVGQGGGNNSGGGGGGSTPGTNPDAPRPLDGGLTCAMGSEIAAPPLASLLALALLLLLARRRRR